MRIWGNESGVSKMKVLFWLVIIVLGFSEGIKYLSVQIDYQKMKDTMSTKASVAQVLKEEEILTDLAAKAKELGLPLERDSFILSRDEDKGTMTIQTAWTSEVQYLWGICGTSCTQSYRFEPIVEESYRR